MIYTTDNGPHMNTWPDGGTTPFRSEKNTNWEGAFRVPGDDPLAGPHPAGHRCRTRSSAASTGSRRCSRRPATPTSRTSCSTGHQAGGKTYKVHLDGYNQLPYLTGQSRQSARKEFFYFNDDGDLVALRYENWKLVFEEQRAPGTLRDLGRAVHQAAGAEDVRPARRPLRARRHHLEHLLRLADSTTPT